VLRPLLALVAVAAIVPQVVLLAAAIHIQNSGKAVDAGNGARAKSEALAAKAVEPWDAATWYQLAKVETRLREFDGARSAILSAIRRSPRDYTLWVAAAQIDGLRGDIAGVHRDFAEVRKLNPYAPLLHSES
jgi:predicted Zn-dependent protease